MLVLLVLVLMQQGLARGWGGGKAEPWKRSACVAGQPDSWGSPLHLALIASVEAATIFALASIPGLASVMK